MIRLKVLAAGCGKTYKRSGWYRWRLASSVLLAMTAFFLLPDGAIHRFGQTADAAPRVEQGVLHLSEWDFAAEGPVALQGYWEFYPHRFLDPMDTASEDGKCGLITVPALWNTFETSQGKMGPYGSGTYRLKAYLKHVEGVIYGLKIPELATSYRLFVNGEEVAANGEPGASKETTVPKWRPQVAVFETDSPDVEIMVHVANHSHTKGGMWKSIYLGRAEQIFRERDLAIGFELLVFGGLTALAVYHLMVFALRKQHPPSLFLGILCLVIAVRVVLTGEIFLAALIPNLDFELLVALKYLTVPLMLSILVCFMSRVYPGGLPRVLQAFTHCLNLISVMTIMALPLADYAQLEQPFQLIGLLVSIYILAAIVGAVRRGEKGARHLLISATILFGTVLSDIGYANRLHGEVGLSNTIPFGLLVFAIGETLVLAERFTSALSNAEALTVELDHKVQQRTQQLEDAYQRLQIAATKDTLTSLYNRYHLQSVIEEENLKYRRQATPDMVYSLIYLDLDNFKQFNDAFGHGVGDFILQQFAEVLLEVATSAEQVYRIGGDEFVILLPNKGLGSAQELAQGIIETLEKSRFPLDILADTLGIIQGGFEQVTCSIGIAGHIPGSIFDLDEILGAADGAMLRAKQSGKHQICLVSDPDTPERAK